MSKVTYFLGNMLFANADASRFVVDGKSYHLVELETRMDDTVVHTCLASKNSAIARP